MKITKLERKPINVTYVINAEESELNSAKQAILKRLKNSVKVPGFRPGKAPLEVIEKQVDQNELQNDLINQVVSDLYALSVKDNDFRVVGDPEVSILKFVPYTVLEFSVKAEILGKVTVPDYKKWTIKRLKDKATDKDVKQAIEEIRRRSAKHTPVNRETKSGDQVIFDFKGSDFKTKEELASATAMDYTLVLGSGNFIPGFEEEMIGLKIGETKSFNITFPKDYSEPTFRSRKVTFDIEIKEINELSLPELNDDFAKTVGPFKDLAELEEQVKTELQLDKDSASERQFEDKIFEDLAKQTKAVYPDKIIDLEVEKLIAEEKQNALYRGQTWEEYLKASELTETTYNEKIKKLAEDRIKAGLAIGEIADIERIEVTSNELENRLDQMKKQHSDPQMLEELDKPDNRREILMRITSEKVLSHIKACIK